MIKEKEIADQKDFDNNRYRVMMKLFKGGLQIVMKGHENSNDYLQMLNEFENYLTEKVK
jgi:hypothetical protein